MKKECKGAKILLIDIEKYPTLAWVYGKYETNVLKVELPATIISFAYKWYGDKHTIVRSGDVLTAYELAEELWELLDRADIVVAHNGNKFDIKEIQTFLIGLGFKPPSPFKGVDTLQIARRHFRFFGNSLDNLAEFFDLGQKKHPPKETWYGCYKGDKKAWAAMKVYTKHDVVLLDKLYTILRPWCPRHPNMAVFAPVGKLVCSSCGGVHVEETINKYYTNASAYRKYVCLDCGAWSRLRKADGVVRPSTIVADRR